MASLQGYKTYILAAAGALVTIAYILNWIPQDKWQAIMGLIVSAAAATLKMGQVTETSKVIEMVKKSEGKENCR